jgi:hypothetical protein
MPFMVPVAEPLGLPAVPEVQSVQYVVPASAAGEIARTIANASKAVEIFFIKPPDVMHLLGYVWQGRQTL